MSYLKKASEIAIELSDRLSQIKTENQFGSEIGSTVLRGRRRIDDHQIPCVVLIEGPDNPIQAQARIAQSAITQTYILVSYDKCHPNHPNDKAHVLIRDLKRAIFHDGTTLGDKVRKVTYVGRDIGPRGDGVDIVCATVEITVEYVEDFADA
ncbi:tail-completion of type 1 protein [Curvibacter phage PCA1]|nr:tail-completion of type 1 protein [Curvibacter phage PCA1]